MSPAPLAFKYSPRRSSNQPYPLRRPQDHRLAIDIADNGQRLCFGVVPVRRFSMKASAGSVSARSCALLGKPDRL